MEIETKIDEDKEIMDSEVNVEIYGELELE
jgi:hypothetical protein